MLIQFFAAQKMYPPPFRCYVPDSALSFSSFRCFIKGNGGAIFYVISIGHRKTSVPVIFHLTSTT